VAKSPADRGRRLDRLRLGLLAPVVGAVAILVLAWPIRSQVARVTADTSWQVGLHQAAQDGLRFGRDIVFTYGPLGFLARPIPFVGPTSAIAFITTAAIYLALIGLLLHASMRVFPVWLAALVTLAFARAIGWLEPFEALQILAFGLGVEVLRREEVASQWYVAVIAGLLAGFGVLTKGNVGVVVSVMALVVVLAVSRPRLVGTLAFAGTMTATTVGLWVLAGQHLTDLVPYVRGTAEIISGYSDAMGVAVHGWIYAAFLFVAAIVVAVAYRTARSWSRDRRMALAALVVILLFACWKFAFVRSHVAPTFVTLAFATLFLLPATMRIRVAVPVLIAVSIAFVLVVRLPVARYADVVTSSADFLREARDSALPWRWDEAAERTREDLQTAFEVPPSIVAAIDGHTVSIDPSAAAIATAYPGLTWRPEPIFQSYSAYTAALDRTNADLLRSAERPELILRQFVPGRRTQTIPYAIDQRNYWFESPEATVERLCRYREVAASGNYQVLADSDRQCGPETPLGTVTAAPGESVAIPPAPSPDDMVLVRIRGVGDSPLARLQSALWRSPVWNVLIDGFRFRLVPGTASDGLVLAVPTTAQGSAPFAFGAPKQTIAVRGTGPGSPDKLTYDFFTRRVPGS